MTPKTANPAVPETPAVEQPLPETTPRPAKDDTPTRPNGETVHVGKPVLKIDALSMACGHAKYVTDELPRDILHGVILASPHAHARI
jgi:hypothetical protein